MYGQHEQLHPGPLLDLVLTIPPAIEVLDLVTAKQHLRVDYTDQDAVILDKLTSVRQSLDGYSGYLGRALVSQGWTLYLDRFPRHDWDWSWLTPYGPRELILPLPPLISVGSIGYVDEDGDNQTLDPTTYVVRTGPRSSIALKFGQTWPLTSRDPRSVTIPFVCGFDSVSEVAPALMVPGPIRQAMLLLLSDLFENREAVVVAESRVTQILNPTANDLLSRYKTTWL